MDPPIPEEILELLEASEDFLARDLREELLDAALGERRARLLLGFRRLKSRYHLEFPSRGEEQRRGPDGNPVRNSGPFPRPEAEFPTEFRDEGLEEVPRPVRDSGNILKQGYLEKRSRDPVFFGSDWHRRWCVLTRGNFLYFTNDKSKQPKGSFSMENYSARRNSQLRKDSRKNCCFQLVCPGKRSYEFTAPSVAEAEDWVEQIQFLLKDLSSLTIPCDEDEPDDLYNDVDSSDSMENSQNSQNSQNLGPEEPPQGDDIYEVLPEEEPEPPFPEDEEDFGSGESGDSERDFSRFYQGLWDCSADNPDELSFLRGDVIRILSKEYHSYGWWVGQLRGHIGIVPRDFLAPAYELEEL